MSWSRHYRCPRDRIRQSRSKESCIAGSESGSQEGSDNNNDNDDVSIEDAVLRLNHEQKDNQNNSQWQWPDQEQLRVQLNNLSPNDPSRLAWENLIDHENVNKNASNEWYPGRNIVDYLLFVGKNDPNWGMTRKMLQWIVDLLLTLQVEGYLDEDLKIPTNATTIEKWWIYIPKPPTSLVNCYFIEFVRSEYCKYYCITMLFMCECNITC